MWYVYELAKYNEMHYVVYADGATILLFRCSLWFSVNKEHLTDPSISVCLIFHHTVAIVTLEHCHNSDCCSHCYKNGLGSHCYSNDRDDIFATVILGTILPQISLLRLLAC
jgi:hypothetical protein